MFVVANGLTTNVPWTIPGVVIEQVGEVIRLVSSVLVAWLYASNVHAVSEGDNPLPANRTVDPSVAFDGNRVKVPAEETTAKTV
jgi:hypothetical protein